MSFYLNEYLLRIDSYMVALGCTNGAVLHNDSLSYFSAFPSQPLQCEESRRSRTPQGNQVPAIVLRVEDGWLGGSGVGRGSP